jgi:signal transduction histidine kinase
MAHPNFSLNTPPVAEMFVFIGLSALHLDLRLSVFSGFIAAAEYGAIVWYTPHHQQYPLVEPLFSGPVPYVARASILLGCGLVTGMVSCELYLRMMSATRATEETQAAQKADELKSQFLADVSHEIRTPLNAVLGYAHLLSVDKSLSVGQRHAITSINASGTHLLGVLNEVLDLAKIETGHETPSLLQFDMRVLATDIQSMFEPICTKKGLRWRCDIDAKQNRVIGDELKLRQVLTNLVANAVKATSSGHVKLSIRSAQSNLFEFEVSDTGPGISSDEQARIFEPFTQGMASPPRTGVGLGLAIALRHVELMGGTLNLESTERDGARFHFTIVLPNVRSDASTATSNDGFVVRLRAGYSVDALIVDAEPDPQGAAILCQILERIGISVRVATNPREADDLLSKRLPDIVFVNIGRPGTDDFHYATQMQMRLSGSETALVELSASVLAH